MKNLLALFGLRPIEINVYQAIFYGGTMNATDIAKQANISRTSVYDILEDLIKVGLITESQKGGVKVFAVLPPEKIQLLIEEKQKELVLAKEALDLLSREYQQDQKHLTPRLQLFEGQKELQQMMKDLLLYRDITILAYWPVKATIKLLTPEFLNYFHRQRVERNIKIKVIWPEKQLPPINKFEFFGSSEELKRQARIAPAQVDFSLGYVIYANTVRFLSSQKENFGFLVESSELAQMMTSQFNLIWQQAKPYS